MHALAEAAQTLKTLLVKSNRKTTTSHVQGTCIEEPKHYQFCRFTLSLVGAVNLYSFDRPAYFTNF